MRVSILAGVKAEKPMAHRYPFLTCLRVLACLTAGIAHLTVAQELVPLPDVSVAGPSAPTTPLRDPAHGYPYNATPVDLAKQGYVEEEFFIEGKANAYNTPAGQAGSVKESGHPYKTRILVRRPKAAAKFNGTVIVEWYNVSQGHDGEYDWFQSAEHILRSGYAWVGVSDQRVGVNSLKEWSPLRYATLDVTDGGKVTDDSLCYDIFTAAGEAVRVNSK